MGMSRPQLEGWFSARGARAFHARQVMKWVYHRDTDDFDVMTDLSRAFLASASGHLGLLDEARRIWRELLEINPEYSPVEHINRLPFRNPSDAEKFTDGLQRAGILQ